MTIRHAQLSPDHLKAAMHTTLSGEIDRRTRFRIGVVHKLSWATVCYFSFGFLAWSLFLLIPYDELLVLHKIYPKRTVEERWQLLGLFLVIGGVGTQLLAALIELR